MHNLLLLEGFLGRFVQFQADHENQRMVEFKTGFVGLAQALGQKRARANEEDRRTGRQFNLFNVLDVSRREVKTHSRLLAELLNPNGSHSQGNTFLSHFMDVLHGLRSVCNHEFPESSVQSGTWQIHCEKRTIQGNLDIVLESPGLLLVIENKIDAGDQPEQLARYAKWLKKSARPDQASALLYLTLDGHESDEARGEEYFVLSYEKHIQLWLDYCFDSVTAPRIRDMLAQYREIIASLEAERL